MSESTDDRRKAKPVKDRGALVELIGRIAVNCRNEGMETSAARLEAQLAALDEAESKAFVIGQSRVGKSCLINALVEAPILPTGVVPCTAVLVDVSYGNAPAATVYLPAGPLAVPVSDVHEYIDEEKNPGNLRQVSRLEIRVPAPLLGEGIHLCDTPGIESLHELHERVLLDNLGDADCAVFVFRAPMMPPGRGEVALRYARAQEVCGVAHRRPE